MGGSSTIQKGTRSAGRHSTHSHLRDCLLLGGASVPKQDIADELGHLGWDIRGIQLDAIPSHYRKSVHVGLVFLDQENANPDDSWRYEELLSHQSIKWIAILPSDLPQHHELWKMVGEHFYDYHTRPIDMHHLVRTMGHAHGMGMLAKLLFDQKTPDSSDDGILGSSVAISELKDKIKKFSPIDAPVLIEGDSGTGKELVARAIVQASSRKDKPFLAVNCGAIPPGLIHSELFGHEKGSFTSAHCRHIGHFESADGGTIFLDEIVDLPLELQAVLLRVLEEGAIRRVGGGEDIPIDVRILSASNLGLKQAIAQGKFREDLYFRLNVLSLKTPTLSDRREDIPLLSRHIIDDFVRKTPGTHPKTVSKAANELMALYDWPGNVRELINRLQQAVVISDTNTIRPKDLGLERRVNKRISSETLEQTRDRAEKQALLSALDRDKNITHAAKALGVSRVTIYRLMTKYGIDTPS